MRRETTEDLYSTILENLCGFDLQEMDGMDKLELRRHFETAAEAWQRLDEKLQAGEQLPLDWQPPEEDSLCGESSGRAAVGDLRRIGDSLRRN